MMKCLLKSKCLVAVALLAVAASTALAYTYTSTQPMGAYDKFTWSVWVTDVEYGHLDDVDVIVEFEYWNGSAWVAGSTSSATTDNTGYAIGTFYVQAPGIEGGGSSDFFKIKTASVVKSGWHTSIGTPVPSEWSANWTTVQDNGSGSGGKDYSKILSNVVLEYGD